MKTAASMLFGVLVLVLRMDVAAAAVITVNITGHITSLGVDHPMSDQMYLDEPITASYTYDTATGPYSPNTYYPTMPPASATVTIGPFTFQSMLPPPSTCCGAQPPLQVNVFPSTSGDGSNVWINVGASQVLQGGVPLDGPNPILVSFSFNDPTGHWPADASLPTGAPALSDLTHSSIYIWMPSATSSQSINMQIDSVALAPTTFEVSPASGNFLNQQHFDAALVLPPGAQITAAQASVAGNAIPYLSYPGQCALVANIAGQTGVLCPNASQVINQPLLPGQSGGPVPVNWQVTLTDGTVINKTVVWNLLQ
jgi:hypothetical protein